MSVVICSNNENRSIWIVWSWSRWLTLKSLFNFGNRLKILLVLICLSSSLRTWAPTSFLHRLFRSDWTTNISLASSNTIQTLNYYRKAFLLDVSTERERTFVALSLTNVLAFDVGDMFRETDLIFKYYIQI